DEQTVAQNPRVRDRAVEPTEVGDDAVEHARDLLFVRDTGDVRCGASTERATRGRDVVEPGLVEVDEREIGAELREMSGHCCAEPTAGASDQYGLSFYLHASSVITGCYRLAPLSRHKALGSSRF